MTDAEVGIGLDTAIAQIREDLLRARRAGEDAEIRLPLQSVTVQLQLVASKEAGGKAGFKVPFIHVEAGATGLVGSERTSTVTVVFSQPVDRNGNPVKVAEGAEGRKG